MKSITPTEVNACRFLAEYGDRGYCPGVDMRTTGTGLLILDVLKLLVRKRLAVVADSDDGPVYYLTVSGMTEAAV